MPSDIDIASNALVLIGDDPVSSFTENDAARVASNLYSTTYRKLLAEHPWSFALKEVLLNRLSQTPNTLTGFQYVFQMPTDLVRLWRIMPQQNYTIVGTSMYSNQDTILARYTYEVAETALPEHFVEAFEYKLASKLAISVTEDTTKAQYYSGLAMDAIAKSKNVDATQRPQDGIMSNPMTDFRLSGGRLV